jgi:iron(III) transport system ATP-binding protein
MPNITLTNVGKSYGSGPPAVDDLSLEIPDGSFMCLLGPSGCGKTTTLRMIAGLEHPTAGEITVGDRVLDSVERGVFVPPERREMGLVFQNYALWPHLTVAKNVDFGLRIKKVPGAERDRRVDEALRTMQIDWAKSRYPSQLSGGQQQRVSLARMLAVNPEVLLLDEPLSNLDAQLRLEMRSELKQVHDETGHTIVFVTHDQLEAMTMATHIAVMNKGVLQQVAPPMEIYNRPANVFVARFVGSPPMNLVELGAGAAAGDRAAGPAAASLAAGVRDFLTDRAGEEVGERVATVGVRPEAVRMVPPGGDTPDDGLTFTATVSAVLPTGSSWMVSVTAGGAPMFLVSYTEVLAQPGDTVRCLVPARDVHAFDTSGRRVEDWDLLGVTA